MSTLSPTHRLETPRRSGRSRFHLSSRFHLPSLVALLLVSFLAAPAAWAGPIVVDTGAAIAPADCTLASAVIAARYSSNYAGCVWDGEARIVITVPSVALAGDITVSGSVSIDGDGAVLSRADATVSHRFFTVLGTLELNRLTLSGGHVASSHGGAISVGSSGTLTVAASTLEGNQSTWSGGAIFSRGDTTLRSSLLTGNSAAHAGGAVFAHSGTLTIENSTLADNTATSSGGGGVYSRVGTTIENSTLSNNTATRGGALYQTQGAADISLSTFAENGSTLPGSANTILVASNALVRIDRSAITSDAPWDLCSGSIDSLDWNAASDLSCDLDEAGDQEGVTISLSALGDHGGPTPVHVPLCDSWVGGVCQSPLLDRFPCDAFPSGAAPLWDQRNQMPRRVDLPGTPGLSGYPDTGPLCDVGSYESGCQTTYWSTPGEDHVVRLHGEQSSTSTHLLDNGACYAHKPEFTASSDCSIRWEIYGTLFDVTNIVFVDPACSYDCFESPELCALHCAVAAPAGWVPATTHPSGAYQIDVASCDDPLPLPGETSVPYVVEYVSNFDPLTALYWDPRMPVEPPSGP